MKRTNFDTSKYKVWALPHPVILHWIINPGLAFNELFLGQRIPKVNLIDKYGNKPVMERTIVPCPHCNTMNDGRLWGKGNAFGHWFGYVCPDCEGTIPCLWNVFSLLVLCVTFPIWFIPVRFFKPKWIEYEKQRLRRNLEQPLVEAQKVNWLIRGTLLFGTLLFGGFMWILMSLIPYLFGRASSQSLLIGIPIWLLAGFLWGIIMHYWMNKKGKVEQNASTHTDKPPC